MMRDILQSICKPEFDPRQKINRPVFRTGILKIDDLKPEMVLDAQVVNVVDFGVFVDIGLGAEAAWFMSVSSANHFIRDPHRFFAVGDVLKVWVTEVDSQQRRVKLTAIRPGTPKPQRRSRGENRSKPVAKAGGRPRETQVARSEGYKRAGKGRATRTRPEHTRRRPSKPVKPISEEMLKGEKPMRSFSDLAQFFSKKPDLDQGESNQKDN